MDGAVRLIDALVQLHTALGWPGAAVFAVVTLGVPVAIFWLRNRQITDLYRQIIAAKEEQIQRLADENRTWRAYFFKRDGMTDAQVAELMPGGTSSPPPLQLPPPATAATKPTSSKKGKAKK